MAKKTKNPQKANQRRAKKQKKRQERIKKQTLSQRAEFHPEVEDKVDLALQSLENGETKEARRMLDRLQKTHGYHHHILFGLGVLAAMSDRKDEAIQFFNQAIEKCPDFVEAHFNKGMACQKQFDVPGMVAAYREVLRSGEPGSYPFQHAQDMLTSLEQYTGDRDGISLDEYLRGQEFFEQGVQYMESGDWVSAIIAFCHAVEIHPNHPQSYGNLGICYANMGRKQEALEAFDRALELDPQYEPALVNRKLAASLGEGQSLAGDLKSIEYYKDYPFQNRSYIEELAASQGPLPEKK